MILTNGEQTYELENETMIDAFKKSGYKEVPNLEPKKTK